MSDNVQVIKKGWLVEISDFEKVLKTEKLKHSFLLPGLAAGCKVFEVDKGNNYRVLKFDFFSFDNAISYIFIACDDMPWEKARNLLYCKDKKIKAPEKEEDTLARFFLCSGSPDKCAKAGSNFIRNSGTLKHEKSLLLDRGVNMLVEPRGMICYADNASDLNLVANMSVKKLDHFERWAMLFSLSLAYRKVILKSIRQMGDKLASFDKKTTNSKQVFTDLTELRASVVMFDARYFFQAPVHPDRHELFIIMDKLMGVLDVKSLHEEMSHQVDELGKLADQKLEIIQKVHQDLMEKKAGRLNVGFGIFGVVLALMEFLSRTPLEWSAVITVWWLMIKEWCVALVGL